LLDYSLLDGTKVATHQAADRYGPVSEKLIRAFYREILSPGDAAMDVGVHFGFHLLGMRDCVGDDGLVIGIEANIERYAAILKRIAKQGMTNVYLLNVAAAGEEGFRPFFVNQTHTGRSSLVENKKAATDVVKEITVYATPLDSVLPTTFRPKFVKMDIEGAEFPALRGARNTVENAQPLIVFEGKLSLSAAKFGFQKEMVAEFLQGIGYRVFDLFGNPVDPLSWTGGFGWNYIAGPDNDSVRETIAGALTAAWIHVLAEEV
jgi:FkbM family methyltransferase